MYFANLLKSRDSRSFIGLNLSNDLYFEEYNEVDPGGPGADNNLVCIGFDNTGDEPKYVWEDRNKLVWVRELKKDRTAEEGKLPRRIDFVTSNVRPITMANFESTFSSLRVADPVGGSERQATKLIADLMKEFGIKGALWGRTEIISNLNDQNAEHGMGYPEDFYPEIIDAIKASDAWRHLPIYSDASDIHMYMNGAVVRIANEVMDRMFESGEYTVTFDDFTSQQVLDFDRYKGLEDRKLANLLYTSPVRVRALRAHVNSIALEDQP